MMVAWTMVIAVEEVRTYHISKYVLKGKSSVLKKKKKKGLGH